MGTEYKHGGLNIILGASGEQTRIFDQTGHEIEGCIADVQISSVCGQATEVKVTFVYANVFRTRREMSQEIDKIADAKKLANANK